MSKTKPKLPPLCSSCGINRADPPSSLCHGCYAEHQQHSQRSAKLTEQDVKEICELIVSGVRDADIAAKFGISAGSVIDIRRGVGWAWLTGFGPADHLRHGGRPRRAASCRGSRLL
jgi:hypothetical protein